MNHKLISLRIIFFLLLLYYLRHCAPAPYLYGAPKKSQQETLKLDVLLFRAPLSFRAPRGIGSTTHLRPQQGELEAMPSLFQP